MKRILILVFLSILLFFALLHSQAQKPLKHYVSVKVYIVPLFIIDGAGEPVHDLTKEDLELFIDGKKTPLEHLIKRDFSLDLEEIKFLKKKSAILKRAKERIVFIIMDTIFNDRYGTWRMKKIVESILKSGRDYDKYVVFGIGPRRGLFYITGPDYSGPALIKKVKEVKLISRFRPGSSSITNQRTNVPKEYTLLFSATTPRLKELVHEFTKCLVQLKYALNTFVQPKVVYLISQGFGIEPETNWYLKDIVKTMNQGGAALFSINPGRVQSFVAPESGKASLLNMAEESGGKFFQGEKIEHLVKDIKRTTDAYYEAVFSIDSIGKKKDFKIRISCKKQGIRILMPKTLSKTKTYKDMSAFEKQLFVVDVVGGGLWSNTIGLVKMAEFKVNKKEKEGEKVKYYITVKTPEILKNKNCDIYICRIIKEKNDAKIRKYSQALGEFESLAIEGNRGEGLFFVIVSQETGHTISGSLSSIIQK